MKTLKNRHRNKVTRKCRGGYIVKRDGKWTSVDRPSKKGEKLKKTSERVINYRKAETEVLDILATTCTSNDSNVCIRDQADSLVKVYESLCGAYEQHADKERYFLYLLGIKTKISTIIDLRVQESDGFTIKTDEDLEKKISHRNRIQYWSIIFTQIKQAFDIIRQQRYDSMIAQVTGEYESLKVQTSLNEEKCKLIKDSYEKTNALIKVLEDEDRSMENEINAPTIQMLIARNGEKQQLYEEATNPDLPRMRLRFTEVEQMYKKLGLEKQELETEQDIQTRMIEESRKQTEREEIRYAEQKTEETRKIAKARKERENAIEAARQRDIAAAALRKGKTKAEKEKEIADQALLNAAAADAKTQAAAETFVGPQNPGKKTLADLRRQQEQRDKERDKEREQMQEEKRERILLLDEQTLAKWERLNVLKGVVPESLFKEKIIALDEQIEDFVFSDMDSREMKVQVDNLLKYVDLIKEQEKLMYDSENTENKQIKETNMKWNTSLEEIGSSDIPIDEKNTKMEIIISEWKIALKTTIFFEKMNEILTQELRVKLISLKGGVELEPPHLSKKGKIYNNLINQLIETEPNDQPHVLLNSKVSEYIAKWELDK
jgi:hypothetical protein